MEGRCTECNNHNVALHHYQNHLCYNCYESLFSKPIPNPFDEEPDFVLENETATITLSPEQLVYAGGLTFTMPKRYELDLDCRYGLDIEKLLKFLFDNIGVYENAKDFDKVKYMFKEVK